MNEVDTVRSGWPSRLNKFAEAPWAETTILVIAAVVRLWRLSYHSIWFDEAVSLKWARSDPAYIWRVTFPLIEDKHPPLYYLILHYWQQTLRLFGLANNDTALRALGALLGVLTVAGIMLLASRMASRMTGLLAGLFVALAPILVWYSQELRMFQPAATALVWSSLALVMAWLHSEDRRRFVWWLAFVLFMLAALYSYLFSAFMLPAAGVAVLVLSFQRRSARFFVEGALALAVVIAAFLPLANNAWGVNAAESTAGVPFADFGSNTFRLLRVFTIWRAPWPKPIGPAAVTVYGVLAFIGLILPYRRGQRRIAKGTLDMEQLWLAIWIVTPFLIANLLLSRSDSIFSEDRYLLFIAPFFLWLAARGVTTLASHNVPIGWTAGIIGVLPFIFALPLLWTPAMARENWRAAADYILEYHRASPGLTDAVIAHVDYTHEPLEWYLRQQASFDELPVFFPFGGALQADQIDEVISPPLRGLVDFGAQTAWLTQSHLEGVDDQHLVERWLSENYPVITEQYPAGIKLSGYMLQYRYPTLPALGERAVYPDVEAAPGIVLAACEVIQESVSAEDDTMHPPSGWVHVRLWWRGEKSIDEDYVTAAQVIGPEGVWGDRLYRAGVTMDKWPTSQWVPGEIVRDEVDINMNPLTPPGKYPVLVGLSSTDEEVSDPPISCGLVDIR